MKPFLPLFLLLFPLAMGCRQATRSDAKLDTVSVHTPKAEEVETLLEAWRKGEAYVAENPSCEVFVGSGKSMLPLYRDGTVLVVKVMPMQELRAGMTVIYLNNRHRMIAHPLLRPTSQGWLACGLANTEEDPTPVHAQNYVGTVVRAYHPRRVGL